LSGRVSQISRLAIKRLAAATDTTKSAHFFIRKGIFDWKHVLRLEAVPDRDEHGSGLDPTGSGLKPILAVQDWSGLQFL